jgi:hypothetical protein
MPDEASLAPAVERYHELCKDPKLAGSQVVSAFERAQREAGLTFGGTVQCRSLRPAFITPARLQMLRAAVLTLWQAFVTLERRTVADASLASELGLTAAEQTLIAIDPGYSDATVVSRLDTFFGQKPRVLEYNADSPAGMSYQAGQAALMRELPVFQRFAAEFRLEELRADIALRETLLEVWREFSARRGAAERTPRVAILDLAGAATGTEFGLVKTDFERHGVPTVIATPEDVSFADGELRAFGARVDLVYKRLLVADFLARYDLEHPLIRAYAAGAVCVASSFRCTIAHKKRALAVLCDPHRAHWFSDDQRAAIAMLLPDTRPLRGAVQPAGMNGRQAVLKPNDSHGGEGIVVEAACTPAQWAEEVARLANDDYVVQEYVPPVTQSYPVFAAEAPQNGIVVQRLIEDCNAYVFRGKLGGILTRLSESAIINVSKGGQAIPTFVLEPR